MPSPGSTGAVGPGRGPSTPGRGPATRRGSSSTRALGSTDSSCQAVAQDADVAGQHRACVGERLEGHGEFLAPDPDGGGLVGLGHRGRVLQDTVDVGQLDRIRLGERANSAAPSTSCPLPWLKLRARRSHRITPLVVPLELHRADPRLLFYHGHDAPGMTVGGNRYCRPGAHFLDCFPHPCWACGQPVPTCGTPVSGGFVPNSSTGCARCRPHAGGFRRASPRALL